MVQRLCLLSSSQILGLQLVPVGAHSSLCIEALGCYDKFRGRVSHGFGFPHRKKNDLPQHTVVGIQPIIGGRERDRDRKRDKERDTHNCDSGHVNTVAESLQPNCPEFKFWRLFVTFGNWVKLDAVFEPQCPLLSKGMILALYGHCGVSEMTG